MTSASDQVSDPADLRALPVDDISRRGLAARGLDFARVATDGADFTAWLQAVSRGFLDGEQSDEQVSASQARGAYRRLSGVYDRSAPMPESPVATIASWASRLTVPGGRDLASCAISAVTVSPTHRRRGIARAMLEGELRLARAAGVPMAMLTVSESTLYGRYGFAPAASGADLRIESRRARWTGPLPAGRVDFVTREQARELLPPLHEAVRLGRPGEIEVPPAVWDSVTGIRPDAHKPGEKRAIRYADADGETRGVAVYSVKPGDDDFTKSSVSITYLLAASPDAYAALWRFLLELDLISEVTAHVQSIDEPLLWMVDDQRAITMTPRDHQYLRILDVPSALEAREYQAPGTFVLDIADPLELAGGRFLLAVGEDRRGAVVALGAGSAAADAVTVELGIADLSAAYLGGVSFATLVAAGRVRSSDAAALARAFGWPVAPQLSIWY